MATPAASPVQKRYTAGSWTLAVVLQPSALSQWYPQPIVQNLQFKLWMQPVEPSIERSPGAAILPRLIAKGDRTALQEISQYLSQKVHSELAIAHLSKSAPPRPEPPPFLNLTQPLSYLQLCDLTIVMRQCEQANQVLPVAIASAPAAISNPATQPASNISRRRSTSNVIPIAAIRRRPKLWASSAAAALLAVGLTTVVWQSGQNNSSFTTATAPAELDLSRPNADLVPDAALPRDAVELPESIVPTQTEALEQGTSLPRERAKAQEVKPEAGSNTDPAFIPPLASEQTVTPAPVPPPVVATTPSVEPIQPANKVQREPAPSSGAADAEPEAVPEAPTEPLPAQTEAIATLPEAAALNPQSETTEDNTSDRELDSAFGRVNQRVPSRAATRQASPLPSSSSPADSDMSAVMDEGAISSSPADQLTVQAQPYFQRQMNGADVLLEETLVYTMRVSELGKIVGFEAEGETAEGYRELLQSEGLVIDMTQEDLEAIANLTFRVKVTPNGQVQIIQAP